MLQKSLIFIILSIILYEIYLLNTIVLQKQSKKNSIIDKKTEIIKKQQDPILANTILDNTYSMSKEDTNDLDNTNNKDFKEVISPNLYGNPTNYEAGKHIIWEFYEPNPWSKIIYKNNEEYPFYFFIKIKIPSLNDYENWKNIINNIEFDPRSGEVIIPTGDEETALSIINLMISNFKGDISINDIVNKDLITISINKAKKYEVVKTKIKEQIRGNVNVKVKETFKDGPEFQKDLANNGEYFNIDNIEVPKKNEYNPYEGNEFSFI